MVNASAADVSEKNAVLQIAHRCVRSSVAHHPGPRHRGLHGAGCRTGDIRWKVIVVIMDIQKPSYLQLFEIVGAGNDLCFPSGFGECRQQQRGQDGDDRDDHQKLNQSEARMAP